MLSLYLPMKRQWRTGPAGAVGLDMGVFLPLLDQRGWHADIALMLLSTIEDTVMDRIGGRPDGGEDPDTD